MLKIVKWAPSIILCGFIFYWSSVPGAEINSLQLGDETLHRVVHYSLFFLLCLFFYIPTKSFKKAVLLTIAYAFSDEFHQRYVPRRSSSLEDIYVDTFGALSAAILWSTFQTLYKKLKR
ncbi:MAG TPA: VanZ family protein [Candidatus Saccharimonadales bacterium]|nr:VanZ family protein [Candidatus Saccharimonadales bacterium]